MLLPHPTLPLIPEGTCYLSPGDGRHQLVFDPEDVRFAGVGLREAADDAEYPG